MPDHTTTYAKSQISKGLCMYCSRLVVPGIKTCEHHRVLVNIRRKRQSQVRVGKGICIRCTTPLHPEMDEGYKKCTSCRQHLLTFHRERKLHANP